MNSISNEHARSRHHRSKRTLTTAGLLLAAGLLGLSGCASTVSQAQREQKELERESSAHELLRKGDASAAVGDMTRAEQYFVAALRAGSEERSVVARLLLACVADQRYPVAAEYAEDYLHRHPGDAEISYAAASIHVALGDAVRARSLLEALIERRPTWPEPHFTLASLLRDEGEADALELADVQDLQYLKLDPNGPLAEMAKARLSRKTP
jgi:tetratricopeptide (TPR) repeat protein